MNWMIYGATGYTGPLIVEEAIKRGHRPILAGRNPDKLEILAEKYDLEYIAFRLDNVSTIAEAIADMDIVYHAAGPFIHTSEAMIRACLATKTHYLDISGEIAVLERSFRFDDAARKNGIAIISGAGFDVVPSDCLAAYVAQDIRGATLLETGIVGFAGASAGTSNSALEMLPESWFTRRDGKLIKTHFGDKTKTLKLPNGKNYFAVSVPWGDLAVAYRSTGIPNIVSYMAMPAPMVMAGRVAYPIARVLLKNGAILGAAKNLVQRFAKGPSAAARERNKTYIWAKASNPNGQSAEAWLETLEPYAYTAKVAVLAIERLAELDLIGALTPSQAFGVDFTLEVEGSRRIEA